MENDTSSHPARKPRGGAARRSCPPHGPILVAASEGGSCAEGGSYVASCLACGLSGPEREDGWEAKLAFDEALGALPTLRP